MASGTFLVLVFLYLVHSPIDAQTATGCSGTGTSGCNGHGVCDKAGGTPTYKCTCYDGWGSPADIADYKSPDCATRTSSFFLLFWGVASLLNSLLFSKCATGTVRSFRSCC